MVLLGLPLLFELPAVVDPSLLLLLMLLLSVPLLTVWTWARIVSGYA